MARIQGILDVIFKTELPTACPVKQFPCQNRLRSLGTLAPCRENLELSIQIFLMQVISRGQRIRTAIHQQGAGQAQGLTPHADMREYSKEPA
jgi:hypothetical protein